MQLLGLLVLAWIFFIVPGFSFIAPQTAQSRTEQIYCSTVAELLQASQVLWYFIACFRTCIIEGKKIKFKSSSCSLMIKNNKIYLYPCQNIHGAWSFLVLFIHLFFLIWMSRWISFFYPLVIDHYELGHSTGIWERVFSITVKKWTNIRKFIRVLCSN